MLAQSWNTRPLALLALGALLIAGAACSSQSPSEPPPGQRSAASETAPESGSPRAETAERMPNRPRPTTAAQQPPQTQPAAPRAPDEPALKAENAAGVKNLSLELAQPLRLGGFGLILKFDHQRFTAGEPAKTDVLEGYLCAANAQLSGEFRFNCAGIPQDDKAGRLALIPIHHRDAPVQLADIEVVRSELVDEMGSPATGNELLLRLE